MQNKGLRGARETFEHTGNFWVDLLLQVIHKQYPFLKNRQVDKTSNPPHQKAKGAEHFPSGGQRNLSPLLLMMNEESDNHTEESHPAKMDQPQ
jgi:hypothetical protein